MSGGHVMEALLVLVTLILLGIFTLPLVAVVRTVLGAPRRRRPSKRPA